MSDGDKKNEEKIILPSSDEAAKRVEGLSGWVDRHGMFWGDSSSAEATARYSGSTHSECRECGAMTSKSRLMCPACADKKSHARYLAMPRKEWDGKTPLVLHDDDRYFFDWDDVVDYAEGADCKPEELPLVICKPVYLRPLEGDYWEDALPEDGELPFEVAAAVDALNKVISEQGPVSWVAGEYVATFKDPT